MTKDIETEAEFFARGKRLARQLDRGERPDESHVVTLEDPAVHPATLAAAIANQSLMKPTDFHIGLEFLGRAGLRWRCTDVGTRTILAIRLDPGEDPVWHQGPPYIAEEMVFDEVELERCHLMHDDALRAAIHAADTSGHPGYPHKVVMHMADARGENHYPHKGVLRFDRRAQDGEILHPYAGRKEGDAWIVRLYLPFREEYREMPERDFIGLPIATPNDVRRRADRGNHAAFCDDSNG
jgi:hypothetical protein